MQNKGKNRFRGISESSFDLFKHEVLYAISVDMQILQLNKPWKDVWARDKNVLLLAYEYMRNDNIT